MIYQSFPAIATFRGITIIYRLVFLTSCKCVYNIRDDQTQSLHPHLRFPQTRRLLLHGWRRATFPVAGHLPRSPTISRGRCQSVAERRYRRAVTGHHRLVPNTADPLRSARGVVPQSWHREQAAHSGGASAQEPAETAECRRPTGLRRGAQRAAAGLSPARQGAILMQNCR